MGERKQDLSSREKNEVGNVWLYEENNKKLYALDSHPNRRPFLDEFFDYRRKREKSLVIESNSLYCKIPVIARKPLDIFILYNTVQKYGGFEQTLKNRMWSQIARELDLPRTMTSGAFTLKLKYVRLLYQFECYRCKKPMNQSLLFNDSLLLDSNDNNDSDYRESSLENSPVSSSKQPSPNMIYQQCDSNSFIHKNFEETSNIFRVSKTKDFHESLINFNGNLKREFPERHNNDKQFNGTCFDSRQIIEEEGFQYPYYLQSEVYRKRNLSPKTENKSNERKRKNLNTEIPLRRFSFDVLQVSEDKISLKVLLDNKIYKGELLFSSDYTSD
ncbi:uncharacterized protein LOC100206911 isoform X1 [Hydra vulgaris]|uniref:uncharacterized protein LOC100206911 isoform X1 n=1 Tax=Hydra vulgaris TaxID=6087 RepID=UPI001F5E9689|nr:uncharacterized protein LOC100206911 isoform X1 [Hydra vulgaris]XP_012556992.2 uncharacterized protein LOC100206911 isoform X1 [Hydra vulgaris]XP_012556994.2 uncharacterized protein LOC100206911 isoform X1 [Hydra vulgaris]XP_012556995.2 uncharacterized protein LOC100206911 isoform X1 [Hydra vulgaris]XP_047124435.1 uncharacterized protein LOC100206911 isoform X1 [Hydra vulgaris]